MNNETWCTAGLPGQPPCSGRGRCIALNTCDCEEGWTGRGDFVLGNPTCAINISAVRALYGISGILAVILLVFSVIYLHQIQMYQRRKNPWLFGLLALCMIVSALCLGLIGFYRLVRPEAVLGTDIVFTVAFGLAFFTNSIHVGLYYQSIAIVVFSEARAFGEGIDDSALRFVSRFLVFHVAFALVMSCLPSILFVQTEIVFKILPPLYLVMHCAMYAYITAICVVILAGMAKTVRKAIGDEALKDNVLGRTLKIVDQLAGGAASNAGLLGVVLLIFAAWTQLRVVGFTYLLGVLTIISITLVVLALSGLINLAHLKSDLRRIFGKKSTAPSGGDNNTTPITSHRDAYAKTTLPLHSGVGVQGTLDHT